MPKIYRLSKTGLRLFYKIRHHRGHGIHSPFVFNLITKVVEEKSSFYAYSEIENHIRTRFEVKPKLSKSNLLSFRLTNYFSSKNILEIGAGTGINTLCLTAPSTKVVCKSIEFSRDKVDKALHLYKDWDRNIEMYTDVLPDIKEKQDCICLNLKNYSADIEQIQNYLFDLVNDDSFIIIKGIRTNSKNQLLWKCLRKADKVSVALDLFNEGILFFNPKLYKRTYRISF